MVSRFKPSAPIIGCSSDPMVCRQLNLMWGITPLSIEEEQSAEALFVRAVAQAREEKLVRNGDIVVLTAGIPVGITGTTNMIHVMKIGD